MEPVLKWAGGKRQLLPEIKKHITFDMLDGHTLIEPFVGGGSVFMSMEPKNAVINDFNLELINVYKEIKYHPFALINELVKHQEKHNTEYYYNIRMMDRDPKYSQLTSIQKAARTIYLNRTCYNGLYRVNSKGFFNVPIGRYTNPDIVQNDKIIQLHNYFKENNVKIMCGDFEDSVCDAKCGDIIYLDPPYDYESYGFTEYTANLFGHNDLIRMKKMSDGLIEKGCTIVASNNDTKFVNELFSDEYYEIYHIPAKRMINSNASKRNNVMEVLIIGCAK